MLSLHGVPIVKVTINGKSAAMIVDSGAGMSLVTRAASKAFDLAYTGHWTRLNGVGGVTQAALMTIDELGLAGATAQDVVVSEVDVPFGNINGLPIVGLFGADFLANYDVAFELPKKTVTLYRTHGCSEKDLDWESRFDAVPFDIGNSQNIDFTLRLNGVRTDVTLDSGANRTTILPSDARDAGVTTAMLAQDRTTKSLGIDRNSIPGHMHTFATLQIGTEVLHAPRLTVAPLETPRSLLGADFLRHDSVLVSYRRRKLYIMHSPAETAPPPGAPASTGPAAPTSSATSTPPAHATL